MCYYQAIALLLSTMACEVFIVRGSLVEKPFYFLQADVFALGYSKLLTTTNFSECELLCSEDTSCVAFGYLQNSLICFTYDRFLEFTDLEFRSGVVMYAQKQEDYGINIAASKPVYSSLNTIGGAGLAVNQEITPPCFQTGFGDYSPFLTVDLEDIYQIWMVTLYNVPDDEYPERLHDVNIEVFYANVSNSQSAEPLCCNSIPGLLTSGAKVVKCNAGVYGRYVNIFIEKSELMTICEVEIYGKKVERQRSTCWKSTPRPCERLPAGNNIALNKPAVLSSRYDNRYTGDLSVDGNRDGRYASRSCPATDYPPDIHPWLLVDLQANYSITSFTISNRIDKDIIIKHRMKDTKVEVSLTDPRNSTSPSVLCKFIPGLFGQTIRTFECDNVTIGRYVNVSKTTAFLEVCELEVTGELVSSLP